MTKASFTNPINMKTYCAVIEGRTSQAKAELKDFGFRWHSSRRNWFKFGQCSDTLTNICRHLSKVFDGDIMWKVFDIEKKESEESEIPF
jgi:hypothetical protein